MNTIDDLHREFAALAANAPDPAEIRAELAAALAGRDRRRRRTALVAVAAAVVLVAGGIAVTSSLLQGSRTQPASPAPVVPVPEIPLPADTQLVRHTLGAVETPVTATPPAELTGQMWFQSPGRLSVSWFVPTDNGSFAPYDSLNDESAPAAGYVITDAAEDPVSVLGSTGLVETVPDSQPITIGDHAASLDTATEGDRFVRDQLGFPANERISWQLADGRYIHVWAVGLATGGSLPETALREFAESIVDEPQALPRSIGIGLTLPGFTVASSMNVNPATSLVAGILWLCRSDVNPLLGGTASESSGSNSGSASAGSSDGSAVGSSEWSSDGLLGESSGGSLGEVSGGSSGGSSAAPPTIIDGSPAPAEIDTPSRSDTPADQNCVTVGVMGGAEAASTLAEVNAALLTTVAGSAVKVMPQLASATAELDDGMLAVVSAPPAAGLSTEDLAALAASVRFAPHIEVREVDLSQGTDHDSGASSAATVPITSSMASPAPGGASSDKIAPPTSAPVIVDRTAGVSVSVDSGRRVATVGFTLANISSTTLELTTVALHAPGFTQERVQIRLDDPPDGAGEPLQFTSPPMVLGSHARVAVQVELSMDDCGDVTQTGSATPVPQLQLEWEGNASSSFSSSGGTVGELEPGAKANRALVRDDCH